jgi:hypothetical protein
MGIIMAFSFEKIFFKLKNYTIMQKLMKLAVLVIAISALFTSCRKKEEILNIISPTIAGKYKLVGITIKTNNETLDVFNKVKLCKKDDLVLFNADGTFGEEEGGIICDPQTDVVTGKWKAVADVIFLEIDDIFITMKIDSFNGRKLVISGDGSVKLETGTIRGYWTQTLEKVN